MKEQPIIDPNFDILAPKEFIDCPVHGTDATYAILKTNMKPVKGYCLDCVIELLAKHGVIGHDVIVEVGVPIGEKKQ